jgi:hypothetical protein
MRPPQVENLRRLFAAAESAGVSTHLIRAAVREALNLIASHDPAKAALFDRARRMAHARASGASRQALMERFGVSKSTLDRNLAMARAHGPHIEEDFSYRTPRSE